MIFDHSTPWRVDSIAISKFKATCLAALEKVRVTGRPLRITRFGKVVADIVPAAPEPAAADWMGSMRGTIEICGDIVGPTGDLAGWEALK